MSSEEPDRPLDPERLLAALDRHGVEYLLVGGGAAIAYGATRPTVDLDCLPDRSRENLDRLANAMGELNARLRIEGLSDEVAKELPVNLSAEALSRMEISTWRTDAGDFDVLADIPARDGAHLTYNDLVPRSILVNLFGIQVRLASLADIIASKEWANRPKDQQALPELRELAARVQLRHVEGED
jgi:hypothetical protein